MEQFIYPGGSNKTTIDFSKLVIHIGIQGAPKSIYRINNGSNIILGPSGIFEMDLEGRGSYITSLTIEEDSNHRTIIDVKYFEGGK